MGLADGWDSSVLKGLTSEGRFPGELRGRHMRLPVQGPGRVFEVSKVETDRLGFPGRKNRSGASEWSRNNARRGHHREARGS